MAKLYRFVFYNDRLTDNFNPIQTKANQSYEQQTNNSPRFFSFVFIHRTHSNSRMLFSPQHTVRSLVESIWEIVHVCIYAIFVCAFYQTKRREIVRALNVINISIGIDVVEMMLSVAQQ